MAVDGTKAFKSLALMRDQKIVFFGIRGVLDDEALSSNAKIIKIREFYDAFDESHPDHPSTT
jgi:hypothetical protein